MRSRILVPLLLAPLLAIAGLSSRSRAADLPDIPVETVDEQASLLAAQTFCLERLRGAAEAEAEAASLAAVFPAYEPILSLSADELMAAASAYSRRLCPYAFPGLAVKAAEQRREQFLAERSVTGVPVGAQFTSVVRPRPECFVSDSLIRFARAGGRAVLPECGKEFNPGLR
ncbi:hypothetical protein EVJ50_14290 [Synechococcus sp. RSCCF101]|uniref:hypothetical protein n=1 Tax=Synechococcus sp. RSCCF101 TaxID=2511069 RepID=UPI0012447417|nr:hypothetical protein [Synechococcus sp. RSCCF101]QEY33228.1 hypothetical protein EVJ50_14290 [Synechococcus sp. RSCCF101]